MTKKDYLQTLKEKLGALSPSNNSIDKEPPSLDEEMNDKDLDAPAQKGEITAKKKGTAIEKNIENIGDPQNEPQGTDELAEDLPNDSRARANEEPTGFKDKSHGPFDGDLSLKETESQESEQWFDDEANDKTPIVDSELPKVIIESMATERHEDESNAPFAAASSGMSGNGELPNKSTFPLQGEKQDQHPDTAEDPTGKSEENDSPRQNFDASDAFSFSPGDRSYATPDTASTPASSDTIGEVGISPFATASSLAPNAASLPEGDIPSARSPLTTGSSSLSRAENREDITPKRSQEGVPSSSLNEASFDDATVQLNFSDLDIMDDSSISSGDSDPLSFDANEIATAVYPDFLPHGVQPIDEESQPQALSAKEEAFFFYQREAEALAKHQPERAAWMWFYASKVLQEFEASREEIVEAIKRSHELAADSTHLVPLLRAELFRLAEYDLAIKLNKQQEKLGGENTTRVSALLETAALIMFQSQDGAQALEILNRALLLKPGHVLSLCLAIAIHLDLGEDEATAKRLEQLAEALTIPRERATCLYIAGTLRELRLSDSKTAERDYVRAVEIDDAHLPAWRSLAEHHLQLENWSALAIAFEKIATLEVDASCKESFLMAAGAIYLLRCKDFDAAERSFMSAVALAPEDPAPLMRLAYVFEAANNQPKLNETLKRLLTLTQDPATRAALLTRIGWILQCRMNDNSEAIGAYQQALEASPNYLPALQSLGILYRQRGEFDALLGILLPGTEGNDSVQQRAVRCLDCAEILINQLKRPEAAAEMYERALELSPDLHLAFWRLKTLFLKQRKYHELANLIQAHIEVSIDEKTRHHLHLELARLQAGHLQAIDQAIDVLKTAREIQQCRTAAHWLVDLLENSGRNAELVEVLLSEAEDTLDLSEAKWRRFQAASLLEQLDEPNRALEIYHEILAQDPRCLAALQAAGQVYQRLGRWEDLIALYHQELEANLDRADTSTIWCRIGRIYEINLGEPAQAIHAYQQALEKDDQCTVALDALEHLIWREQRAEELVSVLKTYAEAHKDRHASADALCRAAEVANNLINNPKSATDLYQAALDNSPGSRVALYGLYIAQLRQNHFVEAASTLKELIEGTNHQAERVHHLAELARLKEFRLAEAPDNENYETFVETSPYGNRLHAEVMRTRRLLEGESFSATLLSKGPETEDPALETAYLLEGAFRFEFREELEKHLEAASRAYDINPQDPAIIWCLERAVRRAGQWARLAHLFEEDASRQIDPIIRLQLLANSAQSHHNAGQLEEAVRMANGCLNIIPNHLPALRLLAEIAEQIKDYPNLAAIFDRIAEASEDHVNRMANSLKAADVWTNHLQKMDRALVSLKRALADDPDQTQAFTLAEQILEKQQNYHELSQLYATRIKVCEDTPRKIDYLRQHARILRDRLEDPAYAITELTSLLALAPQDTDALSELSILLIAEKRWSDATSTLSKLIDVTEDVSQRQYARIQQAKIWLHNLKQTALARQVLRQALEVEPHNSSCKRMLAEVSIAECQWEETRELLQELMEGEDPEIQVWATSQMAETARLGLRDHTLHDTYERRALAIASKHPQLLEKLIESYRQRSLHLHVVEIGSALLSETTHADAASHLRRLLARIILEDLNDPNRAIEYLRDSLASNPDDITANLLYAQALEKQRSLDLALEKYRRVLSLDPSIQEAYRGAIRLMEAKGNPIAPFPLTSFFELIEQPPKSSTPHTDSPLHGRGPTGQLEALSLPIDQRLETVRRMLAASTPYFDSIFPSRLGKELPMSNPVVGAASRLAIAIGLSGARVVIGGKERVNLGVGDPLPIQIHPMLSEHPEGPVFRFWVGRALATAVLGGVLLENLGNQELDQLLQILTGTRPPDSAGQQLYKQINRVLPRKLRKQFSQLDVPRMSTEMWNQLRAITNKYADQIGLVLCGNVKVAILELAQAEGIAGNLTTAPRLRELFLFFVSDEFVALYKSVWENSGTA